MFDFFKSKDGGEPPHPPKEPEYNVSITAQALDDIFKDCSDFTARPVNIAGNVNAPVTVCYVDGLVGGGAISDDVIRPLTDPRRLGGTVSAQDCISRILHGAVYSSTVKERGSMDDLVLDLTSGHCAIVFDRENKAVTFETRSSEYRSISEPTVEKALKGSKDAFIEILRVNTTLVRRKIKSPGLKIVSSEVGRRTRTNVAILYLDGVAAPETVAEVLRRIGDIDVDGVIESGSLEEYVSDSPRSPFPQLLHTERSDRFAMNLLDGRVGILIDGLPLGFLVPGTLAQFIKAPEDSAEHYIIASAMTLLRYFALILTVLLPALYVAVSMYHQEMLPPKLLLSIIESKQRVPFSVPAEIIGLLISFELLQEAGLRLPNPIGQTVSIIGALLVGQAAIEARLVSPIPVMIVALTGVAGYTIPEHDMSGALRITRFLLIIAAVLGGMFGVMGGGVLLVYHLCSLTSFGVPYMAPITGGGLRGLVRSIFRPPLPNVKYRDRYLKTPDKRRQK